MSTGNPRPARPTRRRMLVTAGGLALAAGAGTALWRQLRPEPTDPAQMAVDGLLNRTFNMPDGRALSLADWRGHPTLINFWATWCPPCVREMPELDQFARQRASQGWRVLGVAIDQGPAVQAFLGRTPVSFPIVLAGDGGLGLVQALGNTGGGLPFSLLLDATGRIRHRKMGATSLPELDKWASEA